MTPRAVVWTDTVPVLPDAQTWEYQGVARTTMTRDTLYKSTAGFGFDADLANECLDVWRSAGYTGAPSCAASFFTRAGPSARVAHSVNELFAWGSHGGWIEAFKYRAVHGPLYSYDLRSAYLWASQYGYPERVRYFEGRPPAGTEWLAIAVLNRKRDDLPPWYRKIGTRSIISSEDVEAYDLDCTPLFGVYWSACTVDVTTAVCQWYDKLPPRAYKLLTQSFWGRWIASGRCYRNIYKNGKLSRSYPLKSTGWNGRNLVWAYLTVSRVIRRVWSAVDADAVAVFVDSVLRRSEWDDVGVDIGDFRLVESYPTGLWIHSAGVYETLPVVNWDRSRWLKHSGTPSRVMPTLKSALSTGMSIAYLPDVGV